MGYDYKKRKKELDESENPNAAEAATGFARMVAGDKSRESDKEEDKEDESKEKKKKEKFSKIFNMFK